MYFYFRKKKFAIQVRYGKNWLKTPKIDNKVWMQRGSLRLVQNVSGGSKGSVVCLKKWHSHNGAIFYADLRVIDKHFRFSLLQKEAIHLETSAIFLSAESI